MVDKAKVQSSIENPVNADNRTQEELDAQQAPAKDNIPETLNDAAESNTGEDERKKYKITNKTEQTFIIYEVGRFEPGETELELTQAQVDLLKDNDILEYNKV